MKAKSKSSFSPQAVLLGIMFLTCACGGTQGVSSPQEQQQYDELVQLVNSRDFEIINEWANAQTGNNVSLIGNSNFIRFEGDSVDIFLPYYGERYTGGGYGSSGGIEYKGPLNDLKIQERQKQQEVLLRFEGEHDSENLEFIITLYPNGNANTSVNTSERSSITYRGEVQE